MWPYFHLWQSSSTLAYKPTVPHNSYIRSDEGLKLETSAFWIFPGVNSIFANSFDKTLFLFHSPTDEASQFFEKSITVPVADTLRLADWENEHTFRKYYLRDYNIVV